MLELENNELLSRHEVALVITCQINIGFEENVFLSMAHT
jgi:hypothetical protein